MGNLYRWGRAGLLAVLVLISGVSFAETIPASPYTEVNPLSFYMPSLAGTYPSPEAACNAYAPGSCVKYNNQLNETTQPVAFCGPASSGCSGFNAAYANCPAGYVAYSSGKCRKDGYSCPDNTWTLSGTTCTRPDCAAGEYHDSSGRCVKDCTAKQGQATTNGQYSFSGAVSSWSVGGCKVSCPERVLTAYGGAGYKCVYTGAAGDPAQEDAKALPADPSKIPPESPKDCLNQGLGYVQSSSGSITCVPSDAAPEGQKPTKTEKDTAKETGSDANGDGKPDTTAPDYKKTETTTSKSGNQVTTTTKETVPGTSVNGTTTCPSGYTSNGDGTCSKTTTSTQTTQGYCAENPNAADCKGAEKSTFTGTCQAGFSCEGDAAQCAAAKAAYELKCAMSDETGASTQLGKQILDGQDTLPLPNPANPTAYNLGNLTYADTGGSCPPDWTMAIMGRSLTISTAAVCNVGTWLGNIGVALSLLIAGFIIIGGIRNS